MECQMQVLRLALAAVIARLAALVPAKRLPALGLAVCSCRCVGGAAAPASLVLGCGLPSFSAELCFGGVDGLPCVSEIKTQVCEENPERTAPCSPKLIKCLSEQNPVKSRELRGTLDASSAADTGGGDPALVTLRVALARRPPVRAQNHLVSLRSLRHPFLHIWA